MDGKLIKCRLIGIELAEGRDLELIYIPDQTQILHEGRRYRFVMKVAGEATVERLEGE